MIVGEGAGPLRERQVTGQLTDLVDDQQPQADHGAVEVTLEPSLLAGSGGSGFRQTPGASQCSAVARPGRCARDERRLAARVLRSPRRGGQHLRLVA